MILKVYGKLFSFVSIFIVLTSAQKIKYLDGMFEDETCEISKEINGTCQKISDCRNEYENYRKGQSDLKICRFEMFDINTLVCCPRKKIIEQSESLLPAPLKFKLIKSQNIKKLDLFDNENCRDEFLPYRTQYIENKYFVKALEDKILPLSEENCKLLDNLNGNGSK